MKGLPLVILVLMTVLPGVGAYWLYQTGWRPAASSAYGELIRPVGRLPALSLRAEGDAPTDWSAVAGRWALVYFAPDPCGADCTHMLLVSRAAWWGLDKAQTRLRRVVVHHGAVPDAEPEVLRLRSVAGLPAGDTVPGGDGQLLVVDPMGNVVIRYVGKPEANGIAKDLKHLLKNSWVG